MSKKILVISIFILTILIILTSCTTGNNDTNDIIATFDESITTPTKTVDKTDEVTEVSTTYTTENTEKENVEEKIETETKTQESDITEPITKPSAESNKSYTENDLYVLSHVIFAEAGGCSWEHQIGVGSVVLNRVKDERFPNTIEGVVFQEGQYACTWLGGYYYEPSQMSIDVATYLLENGSQFPEYVIFQAEFLQGNSVYKKIGNTYFCYYAEDVK